MIMQTTRVSINNKIDANFIKIISILYHKKSLMETRNRGIYRKVRLLRLQMFFVIMKVMKSYNTLNDYYRKLFGEKTFKVPIDAGFDCPNRDGTVAHGGCTFVRFQVLEMLSQHRTRLSVSSFIRKLTLCTASGQMFRSIWFISKFYQHP